MSFIVLRVLYRGRASRGEDEKVGSKVCSSPPCASNREVGNPAGEFTSTLSLGGHKVSHCVM